MRPWHPAPAHHESGVFILESGVTPLPLPQDSAHQARTPFLSDQDIKGTETLRIVFHTLLHRSAHIIIYVEFSDKRHQFKSQRPSKVKTKWGIY